MQIKYCQIKSAVCGGKEKQQKVGVGISHWKKSLRMEQDLCKTLLCH